MRHRLVQSTLAVAVVAVALLGVPLGVAGVLAQRAFAQQTVDRAAAAIGSDVDRSLDLGQDVPAGALERVPHGGYGLVRVAGVAAPVVVGRPQSGSVQGVYRSTSTYVVVQESRRALLTTQSRIVLLVLVASLVAMGAAIALGLHQARRLAGPLDDLATRARRLGAGGTRPAFPRYGLAEIDEVADALDTSAGRVATLLANERRFAADASHQLRTPLTALSMRLEEILDSDDRAVAREEARVALGQVERLSGVVDHLLAAARESTSAGAVDVDVDAVVRQQLEEWTPSFAAAQRVVSVDGVRGLRASATPGSLGQVLATLLENSLMHGAGAVVVRTRTTGVSVVLEVGDEGPGVPAELGARIFERAVSGRSSTGLGLALARDLAEGDGGRLELVQRTPPVFALFLAARGAVPAALPPAVQTGVSSSGAAATKTNRR